MHRFGHQNDGRSPGDVEIRTGRVDCINMVYLSLFEGPFFVVERDTTRNIFFLRAGHCGSTLFCCFIFSFVSTNASASSYTLRYYHGGLPSFLFFWGGGLKADEPPISFLSRDPGPSAVNPFSAHIESNKAAPFRMTKSLGFELVLVGFVGFNPRSIKLVAGGLRAAQKQGFDVLTW